MTRSFDFRFKCCHSCYKEDFLYLSTTTTSATVTLVLATLVGVRRHATEAGNLLTVGNAGLGKLPRRRVAIS
jgi:hypothetical protein